MAEAEQGTSIATAQLDYRLDLKAIAIHAWNVERDAMWVPFSHFHLSHRLHRIYAIHVLWRVLRLRRQNCCYAHILKPHYAAKSSEFKIQGTIHLSNVQFPVYLEGLL